MSAFVVHRGKAVILARDNVDTDLIIPMQPLLERPRSELGHFAFNAIRYDAEGRPSPDFPFNAPGAEGASIIVAGRNFGCGSSREGAVYALEGLGVRAVLASSFGDIFYGNAIKNGLLPVILAEAELAAIRRELESLHPGDRMLLIDLPEQRLVTASGRSISFDMHPALKTQLIAGRDEVDATLDLGDRIRAFQARQAAEQPWSVPTPAAAMRPTH